MVSAFLILLTVFAAPFRPFTSLRVVVLRARLSEGGGDSDVSDADNFDRVALRDFGTLEDVLDSCDLDTRVVRDAVREGALGLLASIEACERLRVGMWISRWGDNGETNAWRNGRRGPGENPRRGRYGVWVRWDGGGTRRVEGQDIGYIG